MNTVKSIDGISASQDGNAPHVSERPPFYRSTLTWIAALTICAYAVLYAGGYFHPLHGGDTQDYLHAAKNLSLTEFLHGDVDTLRPPGYPVLIRLAFACFGDSGGERALVLFQYALYFVSVLCFHHMAKEYRLGTVCQFLVVLCYALTPTLIAWHQMLLPESVSISVTVIVATLFLSYCRRATFLKSILLGMSSLILVMIRPLFLFSFPVFLLFWILSAWLWRKEFRKHLLGLTCTAISIALLLGYCHLVQRKSGVFNVTEVAIANQFQIIIQSGLYQKSSDREMVELIQSVIDDYGREHPYVQPGNGWIYPTGISPETFQECFWHIQPKYASLEHRSAFVAEILHNHKREYIQYSLGKFLGVQHEVIGGRLSSKILTFQLVYFLLICEAVTILRYRLKTGRTALLWSFNWLVIAGVFFVTVFGAQHITMSLTPSEYSRLIVTAVPFVLLLLFRYLQVILSFWIAAPVGERQNDTAKFRFAQDRVKPTIRRLRLGRPSMMHSMKSLCRNPLFWTLLIGLLFRVYVDPQGFLDPKRSGHPNADSPDVPSYLEVPDIAAIAFSGDVNTVRTPVYPAFIDVHRRLVGEENLFEWLVFSQRMISLLSVFFFYRIAEYFIRRKFWVVAATLAYVVSVSVLLFNHWILTESLSVSCVVIWFYLLVTYVQKPTWAKAILVAVGVFLLIMLRPAFLGLLVLIVAFWGLRLLLQRQAFRCDLIGLLSTSAVFVLVLGYSHLVFQKTGIFNVTVLGASNQFICYIQSGLFLEDNDSPVDQCMQTAFKEYREMFPEKSGDSQLLTQPRVWTWPEDPINFISQKLKDEGHLPTLKDKANYTKEKISKHKSEYTKFVIAKFLRLKKFYPVYALLLLEAVLVLLLWKHYGRLPILHCIFWLMVAGLLFTSIAGAQDEYLRLSLPIFPFVIIMPFQMLDAMMSLRRSRGDVIRCPSVGNVSQPR